MKLKVTLARKNEESAAIYFYTKSSKTITSNVCMRKSKQRIHENQHKIELNPV